MFSMPFGRLFKDYDERAIAIAKTLSINVVLSAYGGGNAEGQPLYNIRRISVHEGKTRRWHQIILSILCLSRPCRLNMLKRKRDLAGFCQ